MPPAPALQLERPRVPPTGMIARLSPMQLQVCRVLGSGYTFKEAGYLLDLSPKTITNHYQLAARKLGIRNRCILTLFMVAAGHIDPTDPRP